MFVRRRCSLKYLMFIMIVLLYFIPKYFEYTTFVNIDAFSSLITILKTISYILALSWFVLKLLLDKKVPYSFLIIVFPILVYYTYQSVMAGENAIFTVLLFSLIFEDEFLNRYITLILRISIFLYCITVISSQLGLIENVVTSRNKFGGIWIAGGNGFGYSGQMIMMLIPIVFIYYYVHRERIKWKDNLFWLLVTLFVYLKCKTIMGGMLIILFIVLFNLFKCKPAFGKKFLKSGFVKYCSVFFSILSFLLVTLYSKGTAIGRYLDIIVNGRLSVTQRVIESYGIHLLGSDFTNNTLDGHYEIVDSEYMNMLISGGIIFLVISLILCIFIMMYVQKIDNCLTLIWLLVFFNAIFNNGIFGLVMNPFSILVIPALKKVFVNKKYSK